MGRIATRLTLLGKSDEYETLRREICQKRTCCTATEALRIGKGACKQFLLQLLRRIVYGIPLALHSVKLLGQQLFCKQTVCSGG